MAESQHALDFLAQPPAGPAPPICVLFGTERFLKLLVRQRLFQWLTHGHPDAATLIATFDGEEAEFRDVADELSTVALFGGGGPRVAYVTDADHFVERHREALEKQVTRPRGSGVLVLDVDSWPANTRLYKMVGQAGWSLDCRLPEVAASRAKVKPIDEARLARWLVTWATAQHRIELPSEGAKAMLELVGPELGLLDQELAKLALYVPEGGRIELPLIRDVVGGWRTKTAWDLNDAIADGNAAMALEQFNRLLQAGQDPNALFGTISWSLRRYAAAARLYQDEERRGGRPDLRGVLQKAGFWGEAVARAERQLLQLGRVRAIRIYRWLLEVDLGLKGSHSDPHSARLLLEQLFLKLSRKLAPQAAGRRSTAGA